MMMSRASNGGVQHRVVAIADLTAVHGGLVGALLKLREADAELDAGRIMDGQIALLEAIRRLERIGAGLSDLALGRQDGSSGAD